MTEKLEKLIALAVTDGVITDRELEILKKKAKEAGVDEDELEMLLDTRLYEYNEALKEGKKNSIPPPPSDKPKSNKEGDIKKCPSCGAPVASFNTKCGDCGHEFRSVVSEKTVTDLFNLLLEIQNENFDKNNVWEASDNISKQATAISMFPIPNSKEAILEFLAQSFSKARGYGSKWSNIWNSTGPETTIRSAWLNKFEQTIIKARFAIKDKDTLAQIEQYAKQLKIK